MSTQENYYEQENDLSDILQIPSPPPSSSIRRRRRQTVSDSESDDDSSSTTTSSSSSLSSAGIIDTNTNTIPSSNGGTNGDNNVSLPEETSSVTEEEYEFCLWKVKSRQNLEFTASARSAFLNSWMESSDFWIERLDKKQLNFLSKLLDI